MGAETTGKRGRVKVSARADKARGTHKGGGGPKRSGPIDARGGPSLALQTIEGEVSRPVDQVQSPAIPVLFSDVPAPTQPVSPPQVVRPGEVAEPPMSHYKGTSLKNIGRDARGHVIPHKRSEVTAKKVAVWASGGYTREDIAIMLNVRPGIVEECYGIELRHGTDQIGMEMTSHIVKRAKKSDNILKFYAKSRMGWRDGESSQPNTGVFNIIIHE